MSDDPTDQPTTPPPEPASPAATDVWAAPVAPPPPAPPPGSGTPRRRRRAPIVALVVILVAAVAVGGYALSSSGGEDGGADTGTLEPDDVVPPPVQATDLHAKASSFQVVLDWAKGEGDPQPASYLVYRDGVFQDTVPARTTKFVDETVIPGTKYRYRVQVGDADDQEFPVGAPSVKTKTPPAAPSTARLEGVYNARFTEVSHYGYSGGGPLDPHARVPPQAHLQGRRLRHRPGRPALPRLPDQAHPEGRHLPRVGVGARLPAVRRRHDDLERDRDAPAHRGRRGRRTSGA